MNYPSGYKSGVSETPLKCVALILTAVLALAAAGCEPKASELSGAQLAAKYCASCHLEPVPGQLPREGWPFVLKWMGNYLGFRDTSGALDGIVNIDIVPDGKLINSGDFEKLSEHFLANSVPQEEMFIAASAQYEPLVQFTPKSSIRDITRGEFVSLVQFDPFSGYTFVGFGTEGNRRLEMFNRQFRRVADLKMKSEPVHLVPFDGGFRLSLIGDFFFDKGEGEVYEVRPGGHGRLDIRHLVKGYNRLTQSIAADFNRDGRRDLVLVGFGQGHVGRTSVLLQLPDGSYGNEKILFSQSGSLCAAARDFDGNGYIDIMLLVAQEHQELLLFLNQGEGLFEKRLLHKEIAGFGYNHFTLADFNDDGKIDIVTSNGNNMEIQDVPLKPHHGIRVLMNQGDLTWREEYFFPMHGAINAVAEDFDRDGDVDIAAIAFYPDWERETPETFVYLRNDGALASPSGKFTPFTLPREYWGRWLVMDAADVDKDGYRDLILGAAYIDKGIAPRHEERYRALAGQAQSLLFLYNNGGLQARKQ